MQIVLQLSAEQQLLYGLLLCGDEAGPSCRFQYGAVSIAMEADREGKLACACLLQPYVGLVLVPGLKHAAQQPAARSKEHGPLSP